jgi:hypothetical protein
VRAARRKAEGFSPLPATLAGKRPSKARKGEDRRSEQLRDMEPDSPYLM